MPLASATRVGPYEILSALGGGSMGEVYAARDSRLSRNVALKILPSGMPTDATRRRRFVQEARSASALNHPNIVTIHDFGTVDGISYIVSELVEGESLRTLLRNGPLPIDKLLSLGIQIADGLAAAHNAGIVHRDLKPENIMVTNTGRVKILDFGLAKPIQRDDSEPGSEDDLNRSTFDGTEPGLILGTIGYMSPEQARGSPVSFQSDQFSLGVMLHEMATGQQAFRRETPMQTLLAIADVDQLPFTPGPVAFRMLIQKCLAKDPAERFQSTSEIAERLRRIRDQLPGKAAVPAQALVGSQEPAAPAAVSKFPRTLVFAAIAVLVVFGAGFLAGALRPGGPAVDLSRYEFTPLGSGTFDIFPALAPGGKSVAYAAVQSGRFQIFTHTLGTAAVTQLTTAAEDCLNPSWSSDGARLFYVSEGFLWSVSALGGTPELLFDNVAAGAQSHDGKSFALIRAVASSGVSYSLWTADAGGQPRKLVRPPVPEVFRTPADVRFSPNGKELALSISGWDGKSEFWLIPWPAGNPRRIFSPGTAPRARMFTWMPDSRRLVYSDGKALWIADTVTGDAHKITAATGRQMWPDVAPDGAAIVFSAVEENHEILQIPLNAQNRIVTAPGSSPAFSPLRSEIAFVTDRAGAPEISLRDFQSGWERSIVTSKDFKSLNSTFSDVRFSPDGLRVAYTQAGNGTEAIWLSTRIGGPPVRLTEGSGEAFQREPAWSPDGNWIAYVSMRSGKLAILKERIGSGAAPVLVKSDAGAGPAWSPKDDWIATLDPSGGVLLVAPDGSRTNHVGDGAWLCVAWTKDGSRIYGLREKERQVGLASIDVKSLRQEIVRPLDVDPAVISYAGAQGVKPVRGASISSDGQTFVTSILRVKSTLWTLTGFPR